MCALGGSLYVLIALDRALEHRIECIGAVNIAIPDQNNHVIYVRSSMAYRMGVPLFETQSGSSRSVSVAANFFQHCCRWSSNASFCIFCKDTGNISKSLSSMCMLCLRRHRMALNGNGSLSSQSGHQELCVLKSMEHGNKRITQTGFTTEILHVTSL